ncbi:hypothetical protein [Vibrio phage VP4B]|uniref:Virion structural protein n=1 Tax=Vibrio phage VP4B TaxID=1262540 RepID=V9LZE4_9CAUD|nr:hypothetical protein FDJ61_gp113 [Vibrio phage VP4B]AGB07227.1 hypothetical protein [Vibrio phage VP4B]
MDNIDKQPDNLNPFTGEVDPKVKVWLNDVFKENGGGSYLSPLGNILHGIKILGSGVQLAPMADDIIGLMFIPRPVLNLSDENVSKSPRFAKLFKADSNSLGGYIRGLLDYRVGRTYNHPALDNKNAWMPLLTNLLQKSDGFPDLELESSTTQPGIRQEVYQWIEGIMETNGIITINQTYKNVKGGILPYLFGVWEHYIPEVRLGDHGMEPYWEAQYQNYWDFDTRIYHLFLNPNMVNIESIYMTISSVPTTHPQGSLASIDMTQAGRRGPGQDTFDVQFKSIGARADTFECVDAFNGATVKFNEDMADGKRHKHYRKIDRTEFLDNNYKAYPWININTMELEWWVPDER